MPKSTRFIVPFLMLLFVGLDFAAPPAVVDEFIGKVIGVTDGDTIKVLVNKETITVRLEGIDAPELGQSYGTKAKQALSDFVFGKTVTVKRTGTDKYGRTLGVVIVGGVDANIKMIDDGWAWHYKKYNDDERLDKLEEAAHKAKRGLWADQNPTAPWDYRNKLKSSRMTPTVAGEQQALYWLNTSTGVRHNEQCRYFKNTKNGRLCGPNEGKPCGICGG